MTNKRELKKYIHRACGDLSVSILTTADAFACLTEDQVSDLIVRLALLQEKTLANATFAYDKICKDFDNRAAYLRARSVYEKAAYKQLIDSFLAEITAIVKDFNALIPAEVKSKLRELAE